MSSIEVWGPQIRDMAMACLNLLDGRTLTGADAPRAIARLRRQIYHAGDAIGAPALDGQALQWEPPLVRDLSDRKIDVLINLWLLLDQASAARRVGMRIGTFRDHVSDLIAHYSVDTWPQALRAAQWDGVVPRELPDWRRLRRS